MERGWDASQARRLHKTPLPGMAAALVSGIQPIRPDLGPMTFEIFKVQPRNAATQPSRSHTYRGIAHTFKSPRRHGTALSLQIRGCVWLSVFFGLDNCNSRASYRTLVIGSLYV